VVTRLFREFEAASHPGEELLEPLGQPAVQPILLRCLPIQVNRR
jgi:hypothetical protein